MTATSGATAVTSAFSDGLIGLTSSSVSESELLLSDLASSSIVL